MKVQKKLNSLCKGFEVRNGIQIPIDGVHIEHIDGNDWMLSVQLANIQEHVCTGDFIKVDVNGNVYPVDRKRFLSEHTRVSSTTYVETPRVVDAWTPESSLSRAVLWLIDKTKIIIGKDKIIAGSEEVPRDSYVIIDSVITDMQDNIMDVNFDLVRRDVFEKEYSYVNGTSRTSYYDTGTGGH